MQFYWCRPSPSDKEREKGSCYYTASQELVSMETNLNIDPESVSVCVSSRDQRMCIGFWNANKVLAAWMHTNTFIALLALQVHMQFSVSNTDVFLWLVLLSLSLSLSLSHTHTHTHKHIYILRPEICSRMRYVN